MLNRRYTARTVPRERCGNEKKEQQYVLGKGLSMAHGTLTVNVFSFPRMTYDFIEYLVRLILAELHGWVDQCIQ